MKKTITLIIAVLCTFAATAYDGGDFKHCAGFHLGPNIGLASSNLIGKNFSDYTRDLITNSGPALTLGVDVCFMLDDYVGIGSGIGSGAYITNNFEAPIEDVIGHVHAIGGKLALNIRVTK